MRIDGPVVLPTAIAESGDAAGFLSHGVRCPKSEGEGAMMNGRLAVVFMIAVVMALSSCAGAATMVQVALIGK